MSLKPFVLCGVFCLSAVANASYPAEQRLSETMYDLVWSNCEARHQNTVGSTELGRDSEGTPKALLFEEPCELTKVASSDTRTYYRVKDVKSCGISSKKVKGITLTDYRNSSRSQLEVKYERVPDTGCVPIRLCNPANVGYQYSICE